MTTHYTKRDLKDKKEKARDASKKHKQFMKGKQTKLVPHKTIPHTWVEVIVENEIGDLENGE